MSAVNLKAEGVFLVRLWQEDAAVMLLHDRVSLVSA